MKSKKTLVGVAVASTFAFAGAAHAGSGHHQASWVASGEEMYPPMVMFEGQLSQTLATGLAGDMRADRIDVPNAPSDMIGGTSASAGGRATGSFPGHALSSRSSSKGTPWVASGDEIYPPMMFSEETHSSGLAGSTFQGEQGVGSTAGGGSGAAGGAFASEPRAESSLGGNELSAGDGSPADGRASGVYSDYYLVAAEPMIASDWDPYLIAFESESPDVLLLIDDTPYIVSTYDVILLPSDFAESSARTGSTTEKPAG